MPTWLNFTTISAAFTIAAFVAEVLKAFPRYSELRRGFLLVSGGFFLGSVLTAASGIQLRVAGSDSPFVLLMAICAVGTVVFLLAAVISESSNKKTEYYFVMGGLILAFLGLLIINAFYTSATHASVGVGGEELSFSEKMMLADAAQNRKNWERTGYLLESALTGLNDTDPRARAINDRLEKIKELQVAADMTTLNQTN